MTKGRQEKHHLKKDLGSERKIKVVKILLFQLDMFRVGHTSDLVLLSLNARPESDRLLAPLAAQPNAIFSSTIL